MPIHAYYDTRMAPVTFDFGVFLVNTEAYRQSAGVSSIHLYIVAPDFRSATEREKFIETPEMRWRLQHIVKQLPTILPTIQRTNMQYDELNTVSRPSYPTDYPPRQGEYGKIPYSPKFTIQYARAGFDVQPFRATDYAKHLVRNITRGHEYVTITLRTTKFQNSRNSNLESWYQVYKELVRKKHKVWVLPDFEDTYSAQEAYRYDWSIAHFALSDLDLRLALYEDAQDNFFVSNGITALVAFSKCRFKMFKIFHPGITTANEEYFRDHWAVEVGETPEFFGEGQNWVWQDDTVDNILSTIDY